MIEHNLDEARGVHAPHPSHRLIPSRFPPIQAFDMASTEEELEAVLEVEGWTNDRLVETRLGRIPKNQWVYGRPNSSVIMAAFLHGSPEGLRFSSPELGAWYSSTDVETAMAEVLNGLRRELSQSANDTITQEYREYTCQLDGKFVDIREDHEHLHSPDVSTYAQTQVFGESVRASKWDGIVYHSVRDPRGQNAVCYRPTGVLDVVQGRHFKTTVTMTGKVFVEELNDED